MELLKKIFGIIRLKIYEVDEVEFMRAVSDMYTPRQEELIRNYISDYKDEIIKYEFGHIPRELRFYRVTLIDGTTKEWSLRKEHYKKKRRSRFIS